MSKSVMLLITTLGLLLSQAALAQSTGNTVQSLRGADAGTADKAPGEFANAGRRPGSQKPIARTFSTQPPLIPHAVENFDEVTLEDNQCLSCHGPDVYKNKKAPRIGDSHFRDRNPATGEVAATRHTCPVCHVAQVDAKPLVENTFRSSKTAAAKKK